MVVNSSIALVFDLDGTLIDSVEGIYQSYRFAIKKLKISENKIKSINEFRNYIGPRFNIMQNIMHPELDSESQRRLVSYFRIKYDNHGFLNYEVYEYIKSYLNYFYKKGIDMFILSNKPIESINLIIKKEFAGIFKYCWGFDKKKTKSDVLIELKKNYEKIIFIGDTQNDAMASKEALVDFIFCNYGYGNLDNDSQKILFCNNPIELKTIIDKKVNNFF